MASNNKDEGMKEERRRRIAERGSDRMALITGRINALPPTPPSTTSSPTHVTRHAQSLSVFDSHSDQNQLPPRHQRPQSLTAFNVDHQNDHKGGAMDKRSTSLASARLKHQGGFRYSHLENFDFNIVQEQLHSLDSNTTTEANNQVANNQASNNQVPNNHVSNNQVSETDDAKMKPPSVPPSAKNSALDTQQLKQPSRHKPTFFSSRELNSCILASEPTRALSSLIIALVVVFYYMMSKSVFASRPLYILLLTDVTIVLARLLGAKGSVLEETTEEEDVKAAGDGHNWGDAVKLLERGLVAYQATRGLFIDCSIYLVVVVCVTSLM